MRAWEFMVPASTTGRDENGSVYSTLAQADARRLRGGSGCAAEGERRADDGNAVRARAPEGRHVRP